ncbi:LpxL/LpxP family Kdo(2)-lipid IV(A) lauroyl/palmitoleoyl acyltransferase [Vibrio taketomensis]|uniref:LpxL/LpxP family Kdo(2)-lipid IV(A) lauroyl/palmitoleoyl acyltransferase n=1 Tax=Vibrio taketomensis TaxID=2572923 RepID=UPI001389ADC4|nr:LpxL/LpxP family Kdo(2)-lipid IV(A) lauroyl/palmitoleoyl acyltransferase [Vibrio taketomensis]
MDNNKYTKPTFSLALLHPKNWGVWIGFGLLAIIVNILPYAVLFRLGRALGSLGMKYGKKRVHVTQRNLELAFPEKSEQERQAIVEDNFKNTGLALIETGITWFWPTWRFKRLIIAKDIDLLWKYKQENKGVLLCCVHALNLEITARAFAVLGVGGYGAFRPHNNPAYNFIQYWGRTHNGNKLIDRKDLKQMIRVLRDGERLFYLPDHDYGRNKSAFVPFFAVEDACTTTGTSILANTSHCAIVMGSGFRNDAHKYEIMADTAIEENYPRKDLVAAAAYTNKFVEMVILRAPSQWMWLHKRYKTMQDESVPKSIRYK